jgi:hypothetical protein
LLSGLFGVGGGFLIVPALVLVASLPMHRAVATSLLIIAIISAAGSASYLLAGRPLALEVTILFVLGGLFWHGVWREIKPSPRRPAIAKAVRYYDDQRSDLYVRAGWRERLPLTTLKSMVDQCRQCCMSRWYCTCFFTLLVLIQIVTKLVF